MKRKVVLHFVTWYPSNEKDIDGIFTRRHIELLAEDKQYQHVVVQQSKKAFTVIEQLKSLAGFFVTKEIGSITIIQMPDHAALNRKFFWRFKQELWQAQLSTLIRVLKPSLLHLHVVYGFAKEAMAVKKRRGIPYLISEHMAPFPFEWLHDKETTVKQPMQLASAVVAVGAAQAEQIKNFTGVTAAVIPNMVSPGEFFYTERKRTSVGLHIVLVGIYDSRKGADYLLQTLPAFLQVHPDTVLHLVGELSPERELILQDLIRKGGIEKSVCFHGRLSASQLCDLYHTCDFYVCSSEWESFGVSVLEALFSGVPVLATNCGGVLEFMTEENGLLIANDRKIETLLSGMLQLTASLGEFNRQQISEAAIDRFSGERIKKQYYSIYQQILGTAPQEESK
jgi:glycosyltransferase involved in cell wall biosynthesis